MSYPPIAPSTAAPTPPPSISASESPKSSSTTQKKGRKSSARPPSKLGPNREGARRSEKLHRRSRSGCYTCRLRRKKCDEGKPSCRACRNLKLQCEYDRPQWWAVNEQRKTQKEAIKDLIKTTKLNEKNVAAAARTQPRTFTPPCLSHSVATPETFGDGMPYTRQTSEDPKYPAPIHGDFNHLYADPHDPFLSQLETPHFDAIPFWASSAPYEVDIKTEREVYVDDVPMRRDSTVSTFNTYQPPLSNATLPTFAGDDWINREFMETHKETAGVPQVHPYGHFEFPPDDIQAQLFHIQDGDRHLLDHFFDKILRLVFPVLDVRQPGALRSDVIFPAIQSNRSYLHCCLSIAAVHLKVTQKIPAEQIDNDIQNHRYQAVLEISKALEADTDHSKVLESTLAFIFLQAAVGRPDDALRDVPWHQHFQAATTLIHRLDLPDRLLETDQTNMPLPPLNMTISAWIDILGSSMLGQMPQFAHTYRSKLLNGSSSGFSELMGCEDRVMYLIAEITCLDALRVEGRVDYVALCGHITTLGQQLDLSDAPTGTLVNALTETGSVDPHQLVKNITALFCIAARVYLQNLVPGFHRNQAVKLVSRAAEILELIPAGPEGFDGCLVWPLLICGASSTPDGRFRSALQMRIERLGDQASFGSFGKMVHLLHEVWRVSDYENALPVEATGAAAPQVSPGTAVNETKFIPSAEDSTAAVSNEQQQLMSGNVIQWREVMQRNGWDYLLI